MYDLRDLVPEVMDDSNVSPTVNRGRKRQSLAAGTPPAPLSMPDSEDEVCKEKEMKRLQRLGLRKISEGIRSDFQFMLCCLMLFMLIIYYICTYI